MFRKIYLIVAFSMLLVSYITYFPSQQVKAGFGISPSDIIKDNLKPGTTIERKFVISRADANEELVVKVEPELDGMDEWFSFKPSKEFDFPLGQQRAEVTAVITVPTDAELDKFNGSIKFTASPKELPAGGVNIVKGAKVQVELITSAEDVTDLLIRDLDIEDIEQGNNVVLSLKVENTGNIPTAPTKAILKVSDLAKNPVDVFETTEMANVAVGATEDITATFDTNLEPGEYFGNVRVYLSDNLLREEDIYFRITQKPEQDELDTNTVTTLQTEECCTSPFIKSRVPQALMVFAVVLFILILILFAVKSKKSVGWMSPVLFFLSTVLILSVFSLLALYYLYSRGINVVNVVSSKSVVYAPVIYKTEEVPVQQVVDVEQEVENEDTSSEVAGTAEVKGISTQAESEVDYGVNVVDPQDPNLTVVGPQANGQYNVYTNQDTASEVLYTAESGEVLTVTEKIDGWYKVSLDDGRVGWIEQKSLRQAN